MLIPFTARSLRRIECWRRQTRPAFRDGVAAPISLGDAVCHLAPRRFHRCLMVPFLWAMVLVVGVILSLPAASRGQSVAWTYDLSGNVTAVQTTTAAVPTIVSQPVNMAADLNSTVSFSVEVSSSSPVTYQWKFNGNDIIGATGDTLFLPSVTLASSGSYTVVITNALGSTTSAAGILSVKDDPEVVEWGQNDSGQATVPAGLIHVVAIAAGGNHSLALKTDGTVVAWGLNDYGQTTIPAGLNNVVAISASEGHSLALKSDGTVVAWGRNDFGESVVPAGLGNVVAIAAGDSESLALKSDGTVVAWGNNDYGQTTIPAGLNNVVAIAASGAHSLALKSDGTVVAWGLDDHGETDVPAGLNGVVAIAANGAHSLALKSDGTVVAWGVNSDGESVVPAGLGNVVAIAAGAFHTLALISDGTVVAWGNNQYGQAIIPPARSGGVVAIAAGGDCSMELLATESSVTTPPSQLLNISTRMRVLTGDQVLIAGFIITGTDPKTVIIRGIGPSLTGVGVTLSDPTLELHQGSTVTTNDNWKINDQTGQSQEADIRATTIPPTNDLESAIVATLTPGNYTAILAGKNGGTGVGLVEVYDLAQAANSKLANISSRGFVDTNDNVMIGGLIVGGTGGGSAKVIVRAIGPSLSVNGTPVPGRLADPTLELHNASGTMIVTNDNWKIDDPTGQSQEADIRATTVPPTNDLESAIVATLPPGNYTAIVHGKNNTTGVGLVEVYNLQ